MRVNSILPDIIRLRLPVYLFVRDRGRHAHVSGKFIKQLIKIPVKFIDVLAKLFLYYLSIQDNSRYSAIATYWQHLYELVYSIN